MVPERAIELCKKFEGLRLKPYLCPAGIPTIGFGHVIPSLNHPPITEQEAKDLLISDLEKAYISVLKLCPGLINESTDRQAAIVDFVFNLGAGRLQASTLRRKINAKDWNGTKVELNKWVFGGGRKLPGLVARRAVESLLI